MKAFASEMGVSHPWPPLWHYPREANPSQGGATEGNSGSSDLGRRGDDALVVGLVGIQSVAVLATIMYAFALSFFLLKLVDWVIGLRLSEEEEISGLDLSQHDETAYTF